MTAQTIQLDPHVKNVPLILILLVAKVSEIGVIRDHCILRAKIACIVDSPVDLKVTVLSVHA